MRSSRADTSSSRSRPRKSRYYPFVEQIHAKIVSLKRKRIDPEDAETPKPASLETLFQRGSEEEKAAIVW